MFKKKESEKLNIPLIIMSTFIVFYTLYIGASFIIPFIIAILFSFAIIGVSNFYQKFKVPKFIAMIFSLGTYTLIFWLFGELINSNIDELIKKLPDYQEQISGIIKQFFETTHIPEPKSINEMLKNFDISNVFQKILSGITSIFSNTGMIFFYTLFILLEYRYFGDKLTLMISDENKRKNVSETINKIKNDTKAYFIIKTIVSFITATLSYFVMASFGLDFAIFWAFLIFILNFIPNVGSIIALIFPISIALIQKDISLLSLSFIASGLIGIQILMGNLIEPKFMGNRLNLSPLAIIVSLSFWGALWGIIGMLLSVPIMVIINIILAKFPATKSIAILLSEKGELKIESGEEVTKTRKKFLKKIKEKIIK
ncbi:MAG: AI-2E family transporter [Candidatus Gracilibacteria bacterium]|nr:AI-2E family transporter [Candidatus Gracilibacteria bacterium]